MSFDPILYNEKYRIPSARAEWWEYGGGCYHVTIKTKNAVQYFGHIVRNSRSHQNEMIFSELGKFVETEIPKIMEHYWYVRIPKWVVMPNHIHFIILIDVRGRLMDNVGDNGNNSQCRDVPRNVSTKCLDNISPNGNDENMGMPATKCLDNISPNGNDENMGMPVREYPIDISPNDCETVCNDRRTPELMSSISPKKGSLSLVIRQFKQAVTMFAKRHNISFAWQSRFYDVVITKQDEFDRIWKYIENNIAKWNIY
ncbi:MAG: hypothetical protein IJ268_00625 [Proteobacteria bacterium]|nr:hypothetical protein [Pseudomonadota bacterium]